MSERHDLPHPDVPRRPFIPGPVRISMGPDASDARHQRTAAMAAMLLARLTGIVESIQLDAPNVKCRARLTPFSRSTRLAAHLREAIDVIGLPCRLKARDGKVAFTIHVGAAGTRPANVWCAGNGWTGAIGSNPIAISGQDSNPIGPYVAACLAVAEAFKASCTKNPPALPEFVAFDARAGTNTRIATTLRPGAPAAPLPDVVHVVGCGAVGSAALLALAEFSLPGVCLIDQKDDAIDATNLNRYLLATSQDVGKGKAMTAKRHLGEPWPSLARDSSWGDVRQALGAGLADTPFERHVAALEQAESFPAVLSGVDQGAARRDIQRAVPRTFVQGNTGGLAIQVRRFELGNPTAECGACRARTIEADYVAGLLRGLPAEQQKAKAAAAGIPWARIEAFLGPDCASLSEEEKAKLLPELAGHQFSVSFVSALAGFVTAAQLLREGDPTSSFLSYDLWSHAGVRLPIRRDPMCECASVGYHAYYAKKWR
jgi:hypothetical protein